YLGNDWPGQWEIPPLDSVHMNVENTMHYSLEKSAEWDTMLPTGNGTLHLGDQGQQFTISLFHQLRCINLIREGLVSFRRQQEKPSRLVRHCMNYLRMMVLCRSNTKLQSVRNHVGPRISVSDGTYECRDWTAAFEAAEANYRQYNS
ncbi:hypothetical protein C8J56DRAFT_787230, partial [Mycena floridula]